MKVGIFDSGVGGITILGEVAKKLKGAEFIYLCDNKHLPYGGKSVEFIKERLKVIFGYFHSNNCSVVFIACHSAASVYIKHEAEFETYGMHVVDTIKPTCEYLANLPSSAIGIMATDRTIKDRTYGNILDSHHNIFDFPSGNLATMVELQHLQNADASTAAAASIPVMHEFLSEILCISKIKLLSKMVLACTHYPHVIESIEGWINQHAKDCEVINPASIIASSFNFEFFNSHAKLDVHKVSFFTTGDSSSFKAFCKNSEIMQNKLLCNYSVQEIYL